MYIRMQISFGARYGHVRRFRIPMTDRSERIGGASQQWRMDIRRASDSYRCQRYPAPRG